MENKIFTKDEIIDILSEVAFKLGDKISSNIIRRIWLDTIIDEYIEQDLGEEIEKEKYTEEELEDVIDEIFEYLEDRINEIEIIGTDYACTILSNEDPTLTESLGYAEKYGMKLSQLNSEVLATIYVQEKLKEFLYELKNKFKEEIFS